MTNYITEMMKTAGVEKADTKYPKFTAKKQLEIIKLLDGIQILEYEIRYDIYVTYDQYINADYVFSYGDFSDVSFEQALAQLTTELMKAGKLDKEKAKEILK